MTAATDLASGKGHTDENFPVASFLIHPQHRAGDSGILPFCARCRRCRRQPNRAADEKLRLLDEMHRGLCGLGGASPEASALRAALAQHHLTSQHASDLLEAFRRDVTKLRYRDWDELMDYCRYSAMPVGRFVLDVHGEDQRLWPLSDALCAALQVINHLQDCAKDYRALNRVYIPLDALDTVNIAPEALGASKASPALRGVLEGLARRNTDLLAKSRPFADHVSDTRLALEVAVIQSLAENLNRRVLHRDPLSDRVHHRKPEALGLALLATIGFLGRRLRPKKAASRLAQNP